MHVHIIMVLSERTVEVLYTAYGKVQKKCVPKDTPWAPQTLSDTLYIVVICAVHVANKSLTLITVLSSMRSSQMLLISSLHSNHSISNTVSSPAPTLSLRQHPTEIDLKLRRKHSQSI